MADKNAKEPEICYFESDKLELIWKKPISTLFLKVYEIQKREAPPGQIGNHPLSLVIIIWSADLFKIMLDVDAQQAYVGFTNGMFFSLVFDENERSMEGDPFSPYLIKPEFLFELPDYTPSSDQVHPTHLNSS